MRRESHRRRGMYRASSGAWGHRAVYIGAVVATAAVIAGFGAALVVYGPLGASYRQSSATTSPAAPTGVVYGDAEQALATSLVLTNATAGNASWNWTNGGPCNASGLLAQNGTYGYYDTNGTAGGYDVTPGNVTLICLNSVGATPSSDGFGGVLNATWYYNASGAPLIANDWNATGGIASGADYDSATQNITACNDFDTSAIAGLQWNQTHITNVTTGNPLTECATFYQMDNNTNITPSFGGFGASSEWDPNQSGYAPADVIYEIPVIFENSSLNGTYEIDVSIGGVTPVAQTFFVNNTVHGSGLSGTVLFTFDMTAAWLYDTSLNYSGAPANSSLPEIYGAVGLVSAIVTECSGTNVCPNASSALVASDL